MDIRRITIGSRASKLALLQTRIIAQQLYDKYPHLELNIKEIRTIGDRNQKTSLAQIEGQGLFVKELEEALALGDIDMAVHSLKDMPTELGPNFKIAAVGMRIDSRDALVTESRKSLSQLHIGSRIGTGSHRRAVQLKDLRPDITILPLRGNVDTRLRKLVSEKMDGIIVAAAAMIRLGLANRIVEYLSTESFLPAVGQGTLAVEIRSSDNELAALLSSITDLPTWRITQAERAFLNALGGGCRAPIAALGTVNGNALHLDGMVANIEGTKILRMSTDGSIMEPEQIGGLLAEKLLSAGAYELIPK